MKSRSLSAGAAVVAGIATATALSTTVLASTDCDRLHTAFERAACRSAQAAAGSGQQNDQPTIPDGATTIDGRSPYTYVQEGPKYDPSSNVRTDRSPTLDARTIRDRLKQSPGRTLDGYVVGQQPQPGFAGSCGNGGKSDKDGNPLASRTCKASPGLLALGPGGEAYLQYQNDAMHVRNTTGRTIPLPVCVEAEYKTIPLNRHLQYTNACFEGVLTICGGTRGESTMRVPPMKSGETFTSGDVSVRCNADANWSIDYNAGTVCQPYKEYTEERNKFIGVGPGNVPQYETTTFVYATDPEILQGDASPILQPNPDDGYFPVDANYRNIDTGATFFACGFETKYTRTATQITPQPPAPPSPEVEFTGPVFLQYNINDPLLAPYLEPFRAGSAVPFYGIAQGDIRSAGGSTGSNWPIYMGGATCFVQSYEDFGWTYEQARDEYYRQKAAFPTWVPASTPATNPDGTAGGSWLKVVNQASINRSAPDSTVSMFADMPSRASVHPSFDEAACPPANSLNFSAFNGGLVPAWRDCVDASRTTTELNAKLFYNHRTLEHFIAGKAIDDGVDLPLYGMTTYSAIAAYMYADPAYDPKTPEAMKKSLYLYTNCQYDWRNG